jgi:hypothetical protein
MKPVSPVAPGSEAAEVIFAKDQKEYIPLPTLRLSTPQVPVISRWELTKDERASIASGADVVLTLWTFGQPLQPVLLEVCQKDEYPHMVRYHLSQEGE